MTRPGKVSLAGLGAVLAIALYARFVEPGWIEATHHEVRAPLARALKIAHLSDLHSRGIGARERRVLALLEEEKPDLIVVTGDSISEDGTAEEAREVLSRLHAPLGIYAVRGNWEIGRRMAADPAFYEPLGIRLLCNGSVRVADGVWLVGLDDATLGSPDPERAIRGIPAGAFTIALFHSPVGLLPVAGRVSLALAGHTHGGQVRLPFLGPPWLPPGCGEFVAGWYERAGTRMYVSRGIGTSLIGIRFLARPEVAFMTISRAPT